MRIRSSLKCLLAGALFASATAASSQTSGLANAKPVSTTAGARAGASVKDESQLMLGLGVPFLVAIGVVAAAIAVVAVADDETVSP